MQSQAYLGGGCFWCTEAIFQRVPGVTKVTPGYAGGTVANPTYDQVCSGSTGHAEVIEVTFDTDIISYHQILAIFFQSHDPTTLNKQGNDTGTQYRSIILYTDTDQQTQALQILDKYTQKKTFAGEIVTEVAPLQRFYPAEDYHHDYYNRNTGAAYCQMIIKPKLAKIMSREGLDASDGTIPY